MLSPVAKEGSERLLLNSVKSSYSQEQYRRNLHKYLTTHGYDSADLLLSKGQKEIENEVVDFIITCKEKGMRHAAILNYVKPVISLCKINDIPAIQEGGPQRRVRYPDEELKRMGLYR